VKEYAESPEVKSQRALVIKKHFPENPVNFNEENQVSFTFFNQKANTRVSAEIPFKDATNAQNIRK
jgi:hypothetical protein